MLILRLASWTVFFTGIALWLWAQRVVAVPFPVWTGPVLAACGVGMSVLATLLSGRRRKDPDEP